MKAAVFNSPGNLTVIEKNIPVIKDDEILIKVEYCGVCGTDFHIYNGEAPAKERVILGHEYSGEIIEKGNSAAGFAIGEKVAVNPNIQCGYCVYCQSGRIHLCRNLKALGVTLDGGFAEYSAVPVTQAYKYQCSFPSQFAAFTEPVSCCLHGINQAEIKINDTVAIIGAGTIGLIMLQLVRLKGAEKVIVIEKELAKREAALKLKADAVLDPSDKAFEEIVKEKTKGGVDKVFECAGNSAAAEIAVKIAAYGATVVIFGLSGPEEKLSIGLQSLFHKELTIKSSLLNPFTFGTALNLLVEGKIAVDKFAVKYLPLNNETLDLLFKGVKEKNVQKYMISNNY